MTSKSPNSPQPAQLVSRLAAMWFAAGLAIGLLGWTQGSSRLPSVGLKLTSGYGALLLLQVVLLVVLFLLARYARPVIARFAAGDFHNLQRGTLAGLTRAGGVLLGMATVAILCWGVTGSRNALASALIGGIIAAVLLWFSAGLITFEKHLLRGDD